MNDIKFKLWIEIRKAEYLKDESWIISWSIHEATIHEEKFFIESYPINTWKEDGKQNKSQTFKINKLLKKEVGELLLPGVKTNYISTTQNKAWDYYHFTLYEGFRFNVHPISMGNNFMRQEFEGTQGEIYQKCIDLYNKWIKNWKP